MEGGNIAVEKCVPGAIQERNHKDGSTVPIPQSRFRLGKSLVEVEAGAPTGQGIGGNPYVPVVAMYKKAGKDNGTRKGGKGNREHHKVWLTEEKKQSQKPKTRRGTTWKENAKGPRAGVLRGDSSGKPALRRKSWVAGQRGSSSPAGPDRGEPTRAPKARVGPITSAALKHLTVSAINRRREEQGSW